MKSSLTAVLLIAVLFLIAAVSVSAAPEAGPCVPGGGYNPACDADQNGQINIADIQLTAGHWNQNGTFTSDNNHNHLGQTWTGTGSPLVLEGTWGVPYYAPLILSNTHGSGIRVGSAAHNGLQVDSAGQDGVFVCRSGSAGSCTPNALNNGVEVGNAQNNGLHVSAAGGDGVYVGSADGKGVYVGSAASSGLFVNSAGLSGVRVEATAGSGVFVLYAGYAGLDVGYAGNAGLNVESAGQDGVFVCRAGSPASCSPHASNNGVEIGAAQANGMYVNSAGTNGLYVNSAVNGVYVNAASNYAGNFNGNIYVSGNCVGCLLATFGVNAGDLPLAPGDLVSLAGLRESGLATPPVLMEVQAATDGDALVGVVQGWAELVQGEAAGGEEIGPLLTSREGPAGPGQYVTIAFSGIAQVRANGPFEQGARLAAGQAGRARALQTRLLDGMAVAESVPVIGVALEGLDAGEGMIWALLNVQ